MLKIYVEHMSFYRSIRVFCKLKSSDLGIEGKCGPDRLEYEKKSIGKEKMKDVPKPTQGEYLQSYSSGEINTAGSHFELASIFAIESPYIAFNLSSASIACLMSFIWVSSEHETLA